jgi:hypothetical protein
VISFRPEKEVIMETYRVLLTQPSVLAAALKSIQMSDKQLADLIALYGTRGGVHVTRDAGNRVRGDTVHSCSTVGALLTKHLNSEGPGDKMMWIGTIKPDAKGQERWVMRPQIKAAMAANGWV